MAPEMKTTKGEILNAALDLVREGGIGNITARNVGEKLGLSSRPIYSFYSSMESLKQDVIEEIYNRYEHALLEVSSNDVLLNMGLGQLKFAREEPEFYTILRKSLYEKKLTKQLLSEPYLSYLQSDKFLLSEPYLSYLRSDDFFSRFSLDSIKDILFKVKIFTDGLCEGVLNDALKDTSDEMFLKILTEVGEAIIEYSLKNQREETIE